jgi:hypothetical protein
MILFTTALAVAVAAVCGLAWWLLRARRMPVGNFVGVIGLAVWLAGVGVTLLVDRAPPGRSEQVRSMESLAWPVPAKSPLVAASVAPPAMLASASASASAANGSAIGSVESLIGGLEGRLAANPNDANGWSLLAQSYAYTNDDAALERAIQRAVELGVDETALRERVAGARPGPHGAAGAQP